MKRRVATAPGAPAPPSAPAAAPAAAAAPSAAPGLSPRLVVLMAVATGAVVANLYYSQPLLHQIARTFHASTAAAAAIVTCTQVGYAAGLLLVVPLGDLLARRLLTFRVYLVAAAALTVCAAAPDLWLFVVASVVVGKASVAGQVMIPFAADLAPPERRGRVVARIMTGLLVGILLARTLAGLVAQAAGWRAIYVVSAVAMVGFGLVLRRALPAEGPRPHVAYWSLVASGLRMLVEEPLLRRRAWHGAMAFAGFSVLWTSLAFRLSGSPYHYSSAVIGLFGLAGVAGVAGANLAGRLADQRRSGLTTVVCAVLLTASFGLLALGGTSLGALLAGIVLLDLATQGMQITNQAVIYSVRPEARSRITSAYMTCYFVGGAIGSISAGLVLSSSGWHGVCVLGACFGSLSLAATVLDRVRPALPSTVVAAAVDPLS